MSLTGYNITQKFLNEALIKKIQNKKKIHPSSHQFRIYYFSVTVYTCAIDKKV